MEIDTKKLIDELYGKYIEITDKESQKRLTRKVEVYHTYLSDILRKDIDGTLNRLLELKQQYGNVLIEHDGDDLDCITLYKYVEEQDCVYQSRMSKLKMDTLKTILLPLSWLPNSVDCEYLKQELLKKIDSNKS